VIDWEIARRGPALVDLLYLATHAVTSRVREDARRQEFARLFCDRSPSGPLARACRTAIEGYMRRLGLAASLLPVMLAYTLVEQALERARRLRDVESANPADRDANCYVDYLDVLARSARPDDGSAAAAGLRLEWAS
jgi:aminoglycoside phosphotransferase (APT) family kinase protein